ncbi:MAG: cupin domain-containing protein [Gemmatimonadaceae bacterium]
MIALSPLESAQHAVSTNPSRPATAVLSDRPDARLVTFRLSPGQSVPSHRNASSVFLSVLAGNGFVSGELNGASVEQPCKAGDLFAYDPNEAHSMRAAGTELLLLAIITPRPGLRVAQPL